MGAAASKTESKISIEQTITNRVINEISNKTSNRTSSINSNLVTAGDLVIADGAKLTLNNFSEVESTAVIDAVAEQTADLLIQIAKEMKNVAEQPVVFGGNLLAQTASRDQLVSTIKQSLKNSCKSEHATVNKNSIVVDSVMRVTGQGSEVVMSNDTVVTMSCAIGAVAEQTAKLQEILNTRAEQEAESAAASSKMMVIAIVAVAIVILVVLFWANPLYGVIFLVILVAVIAVIVLLKGSSSSDASTTTTDTTTSNS